MILIFLNTQVSSQLDLFVTFAHLQLEPEETIHSPVLAVGTGSIKLCRIALWTHNSSILYLCSDSCV